MSSNPKISVIMTTYNHEKYINAAVDSILNQTFADFELIIVNDGSVDQTGFLIKQYEDPRIIFIEQDNQGVSIAFNNGVKVAKAELIAFMSGDDICYANRLEIQYAYFLQKPGTKILFSHVDIINEAGTILADHPYNALFNRSSEGGRAIILHRFFFQGNYLNAPSILMRKDAFHQAGGFQTTSLQLQDYLLWFKLLKQFDFDFIKQPLIQYRVRDQHKNLSNIKNDCRLIFEFQTILEFIFDDFDLGLFKKTFYQEIQDKNFTDSVDFELEKAFIYLKHSRDEVKVIGLKRLFHLLNTPSVLEVSVQKYQFGLPEYFALANQIDFTRNKLFFKDNRRFLTRLKRILARMKERFLSKLNIVKQA